MAFSYAVTERGVKGNKRIYKGTFTSTGGSTGGAITTGLSVCDDFTMQVKSGSVAANAPVHNETLPKAGGVITIVTDANAVGYFEAEGV